MSKKSKMKERVVVELPFMVKRVMRVCRPSDDTCIIDEDNL